jgi:hypothetical protein
MAAQAGHELFYVFHLPALKVLLTILSYAHHKTVVMQIDSQAPTSLLFHAPFPFRSGLAVTGSATLPFKVQMPYAGATVTGLTKLVYEVLAASILLLSL